MKPISLPAGPRRDKGSKNGIQRMLVAMLRNTASIRKATNRLQPGLNGEIAGLSAKGAVAVANPSPWKNVKWWVQSLHDESESSSTIAGSERRRL